jgi:hypothetical protein
LYQQHDFDASNYVPMLLYVATMDSLIIEGLYLGVAAASRRLFWIKPFLKRQQLTYVWAGALWKLSSSTGPYSFITAGERTEGRGETR